MVASVSLQQLSIKYAHFGFQVNMNMLLITLISALLIMQNHGYFFRESNRAWVKLCNSKEFKLSASKCPDGVYFGHGNMSRCICIKGL